MRTLDYSILDVFAEQPLAGNPLAVFHDARSLTGAEMQALARETNLAETTFILPQNDAGHDSQNEAQHKAQHGVRVRIFTTREELPFAGHPTLGTATWLHLHHPGLRGAGEITLQLNAGPITVRFEPADATKPGVVGEMRQADPVFGRVHDPAEVARAIGMTVDDLLPGHAPQTVSTGLPFCIVPLRSVEVAARLQMAPREAEAWLAASDAKFFYCVAPTGRPSAHDAPQWHARMQFYTGEDPATGSASGCCIAWLVAQGLATPGESVLLEQGVEILRPSLISARANLSQGRVDRVFVKGRTIPVAAGRFFLP